MGRAGPAQWPRRCRGRRSAAETADAGHVLEPGVVALEGDRDGLGGAVAVLGHDQVGLTGAGGLLLVVVLAVDQQDQIRVLLDRAGLAQVAHRSEEHTSELQSRGQLVCRLLLEKKKKS